MQFDQATRSIAVSLLSPLTFISLLIHSYHIFLGLPLGLLISISMFLHLLTQSSAFLPLQLTEPPQSTVSHDLRYACNTQFTQQCILEAPVTQNYSTHPSSHTVLRSDKSSLILCLHNSNFTTDGNVIECYVIDAKKCD